MPREKRLKKNKRNETALTTKLMQISLRMDDHIYNHKPVPAPEAAQLLREVASLKLKCLPTNARGLQVIEKLTRLLRGIFTEEDTGHATTAFNKSFQINTEYAGSASPVYSLPNEDKIYDIYEPNFVDLNTTISDDGTIHGQKNMSYGQNKINAEFRRSPSPVYDALNNDNKNTTYNRRDGIFSKQIHNSRGQVYLNTSNKHGYITISQPEHNMRNTIDHGEVIEISDASDVDEKNEIVADCNENIISMGHVNSGISNMAIHDKVGNQMKPVDDNCSQSILDNYANDNEHAANGKDQVIEMEPYRGKDAKARIINKVTNYFQTQTPLPVTDSQEMFPHAKSASSRATNIDSNIDSISVNQSTVLMENNKREMKKKITNNKKDKPKKRKTKNNLKSKENCAAHNCLQNDLNTTMVFTRINIKENRGKTAKRSNKLKKINEIYNENIVNDLSWVENLRYVREISPSEYDPALSMLPDNFWNNYEWPGTWDDLDFEV